MNKREFVMAAGGSVLAGCGASALAGVEGHAAPGATVSEAAVGTLAAWRCRVGERFEVFGDAGASLRLKGVQLHPAAAGLEQFTLLFEASGAAPAAGTVVLRQTGHRPLALYLDRTDPAASGAVQLRADCCHLV